jgi:hypothetical protein
VRPGSGLVTTREVLAEEGALLAAAKAGRSLDGHSEGACRIPVFSAVLHHPAFAIYLDQFAEPEPPGTLRFDLPV